jgi:mediator of replication checkpoint protein 1
MLGDRIPTSDPIEAFSSPNNAKCGTSEHSSPSRLPHQSPALDRDQEFPDPNDSDDSDLPETSEIFKQNIEISKKKQNLKEAKARALARLQPLAMDDDDDDDLEIMAFPSSKTAVKEEDIQRKSGSKLRISEGRKRQMQFGKVSLTMQEKELPFTSSSARGGLVKLADQTKLNLRMVAEAHKAAQQVTRKKEEEWRKHGGQISTNIIGQGQGLENAVKNIVEEGLKVAEAGKTDKADVNDSEDEGGSDEDWEPELRSSASPKILPTDADSEPDENLPPNEDVAMIDEFEVMEDDANIRGRTARRRIIDSESEDENETENAHPGVFAISKEEGYRRSTSSYELPTEDEYDKENNVSLMYDHSEDKENNAVVRHSTSIFDIRSDSPSLPDFTQSSSLNEKALLDEEPNLDRRRPLGELLSEESSITSPIIHTNFTQSFAAKLQQASPSSNTLTSFLSRGGVQPAFDSFSQFSEVEADVFRPAPLLQPGFSELFESATERQKPPRELDGKLSGDVCPLHFHLYTQAEHRPFLLSSFISE